MTFGVQGLKKKPRGSGNKNGPAKLPAIAMTNTGRPNIKVMDINLLSEPDCLAGPRMELLNV